MVKDQTLLVGNHHNDAQNVNNSPRSYSSKKGTSLDFHTSAKSQKITSIHYKYWNCKHEDKISSAMLIL